MQVRVGISRTADMKLRTNNSKLLTTKREARCTNI